MRVDPETNWIVQDVPELRIFDDALWHRPHSAPGNLTPSAFAAQLEPTRKIA